MGLLFPPPWPKSFSLLLLRFHIDTFIMFALFPFGSAIFQTAGKSGLVFSFDTGFFFLLSRITASNFGAAASRCLSSQCHWSVPQPLIHLFTHCLLSIYEERVYICSLRSNYHLACLIFCHGVSLRTVFESGITSASAADICQHVSSLSRQTGRGVMCNT